MFYGKKSWAVWYRTSAALQVDRSSVFCCSNPGQYFLKQSNLAGFFIKKKKTAEMHHVYVYHKIYDTSASYIYGINEDQ